MDDRVARPSIVGGLMLTTISVTGASATPFGYFEDITVENAITIAPFHSLTSNTPSGAGRQSFGTFDISINFVGTPTASQQAAFSAAEQFWESQITGYDRADVAAFVDSNFPTLDITADFATTDGVGGTLASAGSTGQVKVDIGTPSVDNVHISVSGQMNFDPADVGNLEAQGLFEDVVRHEMGHVLGFSNFFWEDVAAVDTSGTDDSYVGPIALATYQNEFDPLSTFIPIETAGGPGTAFAHWDEDLFADHLLLQGNSANPEIMTGFLEGPTYVSDTTLATFDDLGYVTIVTDSSINVVPLPAPALMLMSGLGALALRRRKCA